MNKNKRALEIAAAVISIILGAIMTFGSLILLAGISGIENSDNYNVDHAVAQVLKVTTVIILICSIVIIVIASLLARSPMKNGKIQNRFGLQLALAIILGINSILEFAGKSFLYGIIFLIPLVLLIISMCLKNSEEIKESNETPVE